MTAPANAHFLTVEEVADLLRVPLATVRFWRAQGTGPPATRCGRHLRYSRRALDKWLEQQTSSPA